MKTNENMVRWNKNASFFCHLVFALLSIIAWQPSNSGAQDWATCVKPVTIPTEIDVVILNQNSQERTLTDPTDEHWFQYYFANKDDHPGKDDPIDPDTNGEDHSINMEDAAFNVLTDLSWEVYNRDGICIATGKSGDRFGPSFETLTPPVGADPLPSDIYFIRILWDPDDPQSVFEEINYFLNVSGTGIPKVYGEIKDAFSGQELAGVSVITSISQVSSLSIPVGFYMLHALDGINVLNYTLDGYKPSEINNFSITALDHNPQDVILCPENVALTATPTSGDAPLEVTFDLPDVTHPDVSAEYDWDFGNNMISDSPDPAPITYFDNGTYNVNVTVSVTLPISDFVTKEMECLVTSSVDVTVGIIEPNLIPRYRLYNPFEFKHHYTTDLNEYNVLETIGWNQEGIAYYVYDAEATVDSIQAAPFFRLFNPNTGKHHWTTDANENNVLGSIGWTQEGIDGYMFLSQVTGSIPLYRLYNPNEFKHLWTTDFNERNVLIGRGWNDEGIAGYVFPEATPIVPSI